MSYHTRVLVIGAGMSGLACANELQTRGYQVLVLEARGRAGGRLKGGDIVGDGDVSANVDLGGALIHGVQDNPLTSLTEEVGVPTQPVQECLLLKDSGWPVDPREDERISQIFNDCLETTLSRCQAPDDGTSFGQVFEQICAEKNVNLSSLMQWHKCNLEISCGASFGHLGWKWNEDEVYGFDGDHTALQTSWKPIVEALAEQLEIVFDSPVRQVAIIPPKVTPTTTPTNTDPETSATKLTAATTSTPATTSSSNGATDPHSRLSKRVDVPIASPTRQSRRLLGLDASARRSARSRSSVSRFTVDHQAPQAAKRPRSYYSRKKSVVQVTLQNGTVLEADHVVCTFPLAMLKLPASHASHVHFVPPLPKRKQEAIRKLGAGLLNKCALMFPTVFWQDSDFLGLAADRPYLVLNAHAYMGKPILIFMYGGDFAKEIEEWTDEAIVEDCLRVLKLICGRHVEPVDYRVTRWGHEQYSRMAFTFVPPGVDGFAELRAMSEPVLDATGKPSLLFAGEHTTPYHPSTIHGAFLSGVREAYRLDFALDPNDLADFVFSDNELYQRTFALPRRFLLNDGNPFQQVPPQPPAQANANLQHRRRGAASVMKLRKRSFNTNAPAPNGTNHPLPSRRSSRAYVGSFSPRDGTYETEAREEARQERDLTQLENRTIERGMESYGGDMEYLGEVCLPVHGSSKPWTSALIQKKCYQLRRRKASKSTAWKRWMVKTLLSPLKKEPSKPLNVFPSPVAITGNRSARRQRRRSSPAPREVKSRYGRTVKKPRTL